MTITSLIVTVGCEYSNFYVYPTPRSSSEELERYRTTYGRLFEFHRPYSIWDTFRISAKFKELAMINGDNYLEDSQHIPVGRPTTLAQ